MNLNRGFLRLVQVLSVIAGIAVVLYVQSPSVQSPTLDQFRWREATPKEKIEAVKWKSRAHEKPFDESDVDMWLVENGGKVLRDHQRLVPYEYAAFFYVMPFGAGFGAVWLAYWCLLYITLGFRSRKE